MARGDHDVYILKAGTEYRARPAVAPVKGGAGKKISFRNVTDVSLVLSLPVGLVAPADTLLLVGPGSKREVKIKAGANGVYDYAVVVATGGGFTAAVGESGPKIIVDP